jgi:hypothetical protein
MNIKSGAAVIDFMLHDETMKQAVINTSFTMTFRLNVNKCQKR